MDSSERYNLTDKEIKFIVSNTAQLHLSYGEFMFEPDKLCYKNYSPMFDKARPRQRGYIHGLSKKLCIDEYSNLPFYVKDIRMLTVAQAGEVIDILKDEADGGGIF